MKKTVLCNIPMKEKVDFSVYTSDDQSLPVSGKAVRYPINSFLAETIRPDDEIKVILLVKKDQYGHYEKNTEDFCAELNSVNASIGATLDINIIDTEFEETKATHEYLLGQIVDCLDTGTHILADTTYGPKDLLVVLFTALHFAENFLDCSIDSIVYGQASFVDGQAVNTKICDMVPLYCLSTITNTLHCSTPDKAKKMLKALLSL
ncbi:hypothetical protein B5E56_00705 [Flavonifractor sp. An112]|uniref:TM1812 family CRISPR-associated protein n=1 Tax=Flavonifractor sp. An112 TaxID=1965544 RepID=UPI000B36A218|nr:TM1812 family CRISPR-associated protein [Flavonifractor sp. An112]OUQ61828.1 hypothetical protein B5E56_00705 [Flavonifractor sp. An112]